MMDWVHLILEILGGIFLGCVVLVLMGLWWMSRNYKEEMREDDPGEFHPM
tara:strand:+ start:10965 stop:11114 length:150 start_codon:yes stop_codon:yes gene_type:complete